MQTRWLGVALVAVALTLSAAVGCSTKEEPVPAETPAVAPADTAVQEEAAAPAEDEQAETPAETPAEEAPAH